MNRIRIEIVTAAGVTNSATAICLSQSAPSGVSLLINGTTVTAGSLEARLGASSLISIVSASDLSGVNFTIWGRQAGPNCTDGSIITETIAGPNAGTVKSTKYYTSIIAIYVDKAFTGGDTVTVGALTGDAGYTNAIPINWRAPVFNANYTVELSGTASVQIDGTVENLNATPSESPTWVKLFGPITENANESSTIPVEAVRAFCSAYTSGSVIFTIIQAGYGR
jgi:hypothetical protein